MSILATRRVFRCRRQVVDDRYCLLQLRANIMFCRPVVYSADQHDTASDITAAQTALSPAYLARLTWLVLVVWRISGVRRTNKVNPRPARLVLGWVTVFGVYIIFVCNQPIGQLSLASLRRRLIEYQLRIGYGRECHLCREAGNTV